MDLANGRSKGKVQPRQHGLPQLISTADADFHRTECIKFRVPRNIGPWGEVEVISGQPRMGIHIIKVLCKCRVALAIVPD